MTRIYDEKRGVELASVYTETEIAEAVERLAREISADYAGRELLMIVVLQGAFIFAADLARKITIPLQFEFVRLSSYEGMASTGKPVLAADLQIPVKGLDVLVVEDIVDTGISLSFLLRTLEERQPKSIRVCTLIDKRERRQVQFPIEYPGITCRKGFLVGYGLDLNGSWRELPAIYHAEQITGRRAE